MIYNDSPDNFDLDPTDKRRETMVKNKAYAAIVEIDEIGKVHKVNLTGANKKEYSACDVNKAYSIDGKTMQFLFKIGDSYKLATFPTQE